ncbi:XRE family transcriptional regulator [Arthrobacter frigidicola]|nr:XRE family transcriptional regulator [Arthrobacter frigidicola]
MAFGDELRSARTAKKLTQSELGAGRYSASYVSLLESGQRQPSKEMAWHFADLLQLDPQTVLGWIRTGPADDGGALAAALQHAQNAWDLKDYALAASESEYVASLAREQSNSAIWWHFTNLQAEAYSALRRPDLAEETLTELLAHPLTGEWPELEATVLSALSVAKRATGALDEAITLARSAVAAASSLPDHSVTRLKCGFILVAALSVRGDYEEAWEEALPLTDLSTVPGLSSPTIGRAGWVVGNIAFRRGDVETGLAQHAIAAQHLTPHTDVGLWAHFNRATASARLLAGISDDAVEQCLANADLGFRIAGTDSERSELLLARAHLQSLRGDLGAAYALIEQVKDPEDLEFESAGLRERLLGQYYASVDAPAPARRHYLRAAKHYSDAGDPETASEVLNELLDTSL